MTVITDYTPEEQTLLMEGPRLGAVVISASSLGRSAETAAEGFAAIDYALTTSDKYAGNALIISIQYALNAMLKTDVKFKDYGALAEAPGAKENALAKLHQIAALLVAKSDATEAAGYRDWVLNAAVSATEAGKEGGGFLGWGSVMVNDAERAALGEISTALGM
jgi:tellurite resistance protein